MRVPRLIVICASAASLLLVAAEAEAAKPKPPTPMIFVHGQSGSIQQFETNTMRLASNGFPHRRIFAYEYNTNASTNDVAVAELDGFIAKVKEKTGAAKVDVLAHSRGTTVMHEFLSTASRAAEVRRYVNFDGRTADSPPGGVPTLAIWGEGDQTREIVGAENVYFPRKAHTEVTTSRGAFAELYEFLRGRAPQTKDVVPERPDRVRVAGRASAFPANTGIEDGVLRVYEVRAATGGRKPGGPVYTKELGPKGSFGPFKVDGRRHYEFMLTQPGRKAIHNYPEPFERDDYFYRLLDAPALVPFIETGPDHAAIAVTRMREWWGDQPGTGSTDRLEINGTNVINPAIAPRVRRVLAVFNFDKNSDKVTDTSAPLSPFNAIGFLTGVDIHIPVSPDASGTIPVEETMRGKRRHVETTNVPDWPSSEHTISVFFRDYAAQEWRGG